MKKLSFCLVIAFIFPHVVWADEPVGTRVVEIGDFRYSINESDQKAEVLKYLIDCPGIFDLDIVIPGSIIVEGKTYQVTSIAPFALFEYYGYASLSLPEGLISIGMCAFQKNRLKELVIPNTVEVVDTAAFRESSSLKSLKLGKEIKRIGHLAFDGCHAMTEIILPSDAIPDADPDCFGDLYYSWLRIKNEKKLYVPDLLLEEYKATDVKPWSVFDDNNILPISAVGIHSPTINGGVRDEYYDLQGCRLSGHPSRPGIYLHGGQKIVISK